MRQAYLIQREGQHARQRLIGGRHDNRGERRSGLTGCGRHRHHSAPRLSAASGTGVPCFVRLAVVGWRWRAKVDCGLRWRSAVWADGLLH
jgi:hypothetical protein